MVKRAFRNRGAVDSPVHRGTRHRPLASPVRPNHSFAMQSGTTIRPTNILAHEREQRIAITSVVGRVSRQQQFSVPQCASVEDAGFHGCGHTQPRTVFFRKSLKLNVLYCPFRALTPVLCQAAPAPAGIVAILNARYHPAHATRDSVSTPQPRTGQMVTNCVALKAKFATDRRGAAEPERAVLGYALMPRL
jgi:hypothetical protein